MHPASSFVALAAIAFAANCAAQTELVLPSGYDRAWGRLSSAALGSNESRTQMIFVAPFAPGTVVTGISMRPTTGTVDRAAFTAVVEIRVSSTAAVPGSLSPTYASNAGNDEVIVLPQQTVSIPAMPANRGTGTYADFVFTTPFVFGLNGNPNICVDFVVYSRSAGASWSTDRAFAATAGRAVNHGSANCGVGTPGSSSTAGVGGTYTDGSTITMSATGLPANGIAALAIGVDQKELFPGVPLPFDLSFVGLAPGCELLVNPLEIIGVPINGSGAASFALTLNGFSQFGFGAQYGYLITPTVINPFGLEMIENRAIWVGPEVAVPFAQYVWDFGAGTATAATGTEDTDAVPIVKFHLL